MANPNPVPRFEVGNPGGPGRPRVSKAEKEFREASKEAIVRTFYKYTRMGYGEIKKCMNDESLPMIDHMIISIILHARKEGDNRINILLDRILGKPKESIALTGIIAGTTVELTPEDEDRLMGEFKELGIGNGEKK